MPRENQTAAKARSVRIPLDYFRRKRPLERGKRWLTLIAILAAIGYVVWGALGPGAARHFSPGPLTAVHAMWNDRCEVCHQSFVQLRADAWTDNPHAADHLCQNCHRGAKHSANQIASEVVSCAACHRDHHGINADLTRVADAACTNCHANIAAHLEKTPVLKSIDPPLANVASFVNEHPDFRSPKRDPAGLKFSHSRHMRPGLTLGQGPLVLADLDPADRQRYRQSGQTDNDLITLNCAACHQLDRSAIQPVSLTDPAATHGTPAPRPQTAALPVRPSGDYMLPITYDQSCKACHQLSYVGRINPAAMPAGDTNVKNIADPARYHTVPPGDLVPHGWTDERLRQYVDQVLALKFINESDRTLQATPLADALKQPLEKWRLPNRPPSATEPTQTVGEYLHDELQVAIKNLRRDCSECHQMTSDSASLGVLPVSSHPAWFEHATFSHASHRAVSCQSCHGGAFPTELPAEPTTVATLDTGDVFIPGRNLCLQCHAPPKGVGAEASGGARFDCVECHTYHHGDSPWNGLGDSARGATQRVTIPEFIHGETPSAQPFPTN